MKRSVATADIVSKALEIDHIKLKTLDELDYGLCDGLSYEEIGKKFPEKIKVNYSYSDIIGKIKR